MTEETNVDQPLFEIGDRQYTKDAAVTKIISADEHIARLEQENAEYREKLEKATALDDVLQQLQQKPQATGEQTTPEVTEESIAKLVQDAINQTEDKKQRIANTLKSDSLMKEKFGESAKKIMQEKGQQLGLGVETMQQIAEKSPIAFMKLFDDVPVPSPKPTTGGVNTDAVATNMPTKGTYDYYKQLRKDNPQLYNSAAVQQQMLRDAEKLGREAFFGEA